MSDTVGIALSFMLRQVSHGSINVDVKLLSQYLTLAFIGGISAMSLRGFLKNLRKVRSRMGVWLMDGEESIDTPN